MERARFLGAPGLSTVAAHVALLARRPHTYLSILWAVVRGGLRISLLHGAKEAVVFVQAVELARSAARGGVAHVHAHFANHPATAAWIVHRLTGIPFSFTAHANDLFVGPALLARKATDARFVVAISEFNRRVLRARCPSARSAEVIHCGVDIGRYRWRGVHERNGDRVLCVASLLPKKGHVHLLDALAVIAQRRPSIVLDLVGDGPEHETLRLRARALGIADRVRLHGAQPAEQVRRMVADARVFALASVPLASGRMEGIPVALMEAMASGLPVVATRLSGIPELVQDGITGLLVEPGEVAALADAITRLIDDDALAAELTERARALVERSFNLAREAERLGDLFAQSIAAAS
jgi:glycosyltransferase involved in cell wall biosynthesis